MEQEIINTGLKDKNGKDIYVGDTVRYKFYGQHYFTSKVRKLFGGFYPFVEIPVERGDFISPSDCTVINP